MDKVNVIFAIRKKSGWVTVVDIVKSAFETLDELFNLAIEESHELYDDATKKVDKIINKAGRFTLYCNGETTPADVMPMAQQIKEMLGYRGDVFVRKYDDGSEYVQCHRTKPSSQLNVSSIQKLLDFRAQSVER